MTFDPKTAIDECETLMLDMDGTVLDLAYDNYMWMTCVPKRYAEKNNISLQEAQQMLYRTFNAAQGDLTWYCLDHWSDFLGLDIIRLHRENHDRIGYLPGARDFLEVVRERHIRVLLVTNSHHDTLNLKDEVTGLTRFFDGVHSSHDYGFAKERQEFWRALYDDTGFNAETTMLVDDTHPVLKSAATYGVSRQIAISRPDTSVALRKLGDFVEVEGVRDLL